MADENQTAEMFAGNKKQLRLTTLLDDDGAEVDLTGRIVKFALARFSNGVPLKDDPVIDYRSDVGSEIVLVNLLTGSPRVTVDLATEDTAGLADAGNTAYYFEFEVFEGDGSDPVVSATGSLTIKVNVSNS